MQTENRYYTILNGISVDQTLTNYWCECISARRPPIQRPSLLGLMNPDDCQAALEWVTIPETPVSAVARTKMLKFTSDLRAA